MPHKYKNHIKSSTDLVTTHADIRAGFLSVALMKNVKGTPMIEEAKALKAKVSNINNIDDLLKQTELYPALITASGLSEKASGHLNIEDKKVAIQELIEKFLKPAGTDFVDELVFRFLLIKGDALGGKMRNLAGTFGEIKFNKAMIATLNLMKYDFYYCDDKSNNWVKPKKDEIGIEEHIKGLYWDDGNNKKTMFYNSTVPLVGNNIDLILVRKDAKDKTIKVLNNKDIIALGELKGGIDPAGADEHWKTADTALRRIRKSFKSKGLKPYTFFVGAAIETTMAKEIYTQLLKRELNNAANLNVDIQLYSLCNWILEI